MLLGAYFQKMTRETPCKNRLVVTSRSCAMLALGYKPTPPSGGGMRKFLVCMIENRLKPLSIFLEKNQKNDAIFLMPPRGWHEKNVRYGLEKLANENESYHFKT